MSDFLRYSILGIVLLGIISSAGWDGLKAVGQWFMGEPNIVVVDDTVFVRPGKIARAADGSFLVPAPEIRVVWPQGAAK